MLYYLFEYLDKAFDVPGAPASPAAKEPPGPRPFDKTLTLQGISFRVVSVNQGSINRVTITSAGLGKDNQPVSREIDGTVTGAEVADLNGDGSPEIYVYVTSAGSGSYGTEASTWLSRSATAAVIVESKNSSS